MQSLFSNALSRLFSQHLPLSASRRQTLAWLVILIMRQGTVCLWRLAAHAETDAALASVQRRFYRFFQHVHLDGALTARIVVALLGLEGKPWTLTIDRTNWFFGRAAINILMIAVEWRGVGIPLLWTLLPTRGNCDTATRLELFDRLAQIFPDMRIEALIVDREFIGDAWMASLQTRNIPFVLRLKDTQLIRRGRLCHKASQHPRPAPRTRSEAHCLAALSPRPQAGHAALAHHHPEASARRASHSRRQHQAQSRP